MQKRTRDLISGVAGKPTTTTATQLLRCQYLYFCTNKATTVVLVTHVYRRAYEKRHSREKAGILGSSFVLASKYFCTSKQVLLY
jgi:hypothetical protein